MILAADIGGTKALFACFEIRNGQLNIVAERKYPSKRFSSAEEVVRTFFFDFPELASNIESACFSLAGPVLDGSCYLVNLGWTVEAKKLQAAFPHLPAPALCNDLQAVGLGIQLLPETDILNLTPDLAQKGPPQGNVRAILAPGTGLGEAFMIGDTAYPSEGAHCEFGPRSEEEVRLWRFIHRQYGHVSYEQILSGPGLCRLARFFMEEQGGEEAGADLLPEDVTRRALQGQCAVSRHALRLFVSILGAEAGNLALRYLAAGGVYLGGGIPPKILPALSDGTFLQSFREKGRFSNMMNQVPAFVILNSRAALYGAARMAARKIDPQGVFSLPAQER